ncbi:hypothetical protein FVEG_05550 [Fusarium verticillioides 7600]|uniref:Uncharacterized protein n=1 Tax=Gibberella moniliformis (strain M3125 / FGSC 7600) TaxID=334819 RepID=W7MAB4_GIBM7|nr:hypothetical protein FVEG_05550 [Fusarium verticillioides 7600]EWG44510.1 hypothetical protein FVEG_05550 [Fusarium verticillioides 7600]
MGLWFSAMVMPLMMCSKSKVSNKVSTWLYDQTLTMSQCQQEDKVNESKDTEVSDQEKSPFSCVIVD